MKKVGINTISNIVTRLWSLFSVYIFIPLYIAFLGESAYGLVSFFATMQAALNLLGLGLANTLRREFAVGSDNDEASIIRKYKLLRSTENIYWAIGISIVAICICSSEFIANRWLNIEMLDPKLVRDVLILMGISISLQLIANLYAGCLFGLDYQVRANFYCIGWSIAKSCGSLGIIAWISPNLLLFYLWHILTDVCYLFGLRTSVNKKLYCINRPKWKFKDFKNLTPIWKYTCGILIISLVSLINRQLDKVIISNFLTLTELGAYNVATTLGSLVAIIPSATYASIFPRFTYNAAAGNNELLQNEFIKVNRLVNLVISCVGAYVAIYALPLISVWTGTDAYIELLENVAAFVILAVTFIEFQELPYALALAHGNTSINVFIGVVFLPVVCLSTYFGVKYYGLVGAGVVYAVMMGSQTVIYVFFVYKKYLEKSIIIVVFRDMILPLIISLFMASVSKVIVERFVNNILLECGLAVLLGLISLSILIMFFGRKDIKENLIKKGRYL